MRKKKLYILGSGPRGLSVALAAAQYLDKLDVFLVDEKEMSQWKSPNLIDSIQMRSPITFDLVTYIQELQNHSLSNFLDKPIKFSSNQRDIEQCDIYCSRKKFLQYLQNIRRTVIRSGVKPIKKTVTTINESYLQSSDRKYLFDYLVLSGGLSFTKLQEPYYAKNYSDKIISVKDLLSNGYYKTDNKFLVYGSGQNAAEVVSWLAENKRSVYWILKHNYKITQYPVPSHKDWSIRSALGPAYRNTKATKAQYLKAVKEWTPSITPYIAERINENINYISIIKPTGVAEILSLMDDANFILCQTGTKPDVNLIPFNFDIAINPKNPCYPNIKDGFVSTSHPNIYFTGTLCRLFDGPRQGSIISAGITAKEIMRNIINGLR